MRSLNAVEAISPAIARVKFLMLQPFRLGRTWKLGATAYAATIGGAFLPWTLFYVPMLVHWARAGRGSFGWFAAAGAILAALTALYLFVYVLCSRLRFALFGMVATNERMVRPMWRLYGAHAKPWTWWKLVAGTVATVLAAAPLAHAYRSALPLFVNMQAKPGQPPNPQLMSTVLHFYMFFFWCYAAIFLYWWALSLLSDFVQPSLALESVPLREAFRRFGALLRSEPGAVIGYAVMKPILAVAGFVVVMVAVYVVLLVIMLAFGVVGLVAGFLLHLVHVPKDAILAIALACGVLLYLFVLVYGMSLAVGSVYLFLEAYLQFFLGGRYSMLGDLLESSTPPIAPPRWQPSGAGPLPYVPPPANWPEDS